MISPLRTVRLDAAVAEFGRHIPQLKPGRSGPALPRAAAGQKLDVAADHGPHDLLLTHLGERRAIEDVAAVAKDRDPAAECVDFLQLVAHEDDACALMVKLRQDPPQMLELGVGDRGGGFIQQQHPAPLRQRLGNLEQLRLPGAEAARLGQRIEVKPHAFQPWPCLVGHAPVVHDAARQRLAAEQKVLGEGELADEVALLVNDSDAVVSSGTRASRNAPPVHP